MADLITPTTKLEAVNWSLGAVGLTAINSLEGTIGYDASIVLQSLENEIRALCRKGLWFSRRDVTLTPNGDGHLILPTATLSLRPASEECETPFSKMDWREYRPVMRQGKVFSVINQSYVFTRPLAAMIYEALPFDDCPDEARRYATVVSALEANGKIVRSDTVKKELTPLLTGAWDDLLTAELENSNHRFI